MKLGATTEEIFYLIQSQTFEEDILVQTDKLTMYQNRCACVCVEREGEKEIDTETEKYIERASS